MNRNAGRRATNPGLPAKPLDEARTVGINVPKACEVSMEAVHKTERERRWKAENADAITAYNQWVEEHGIPLEEFRRF